MYYRVNYFHIHIHTEILVKCALNYGDKENGNYSARAFRFIRAINLSIVEKQSVQFNPDDKICIIQN